jgi:peptidoglycan/LPS O-acetylase OafA/YrhL
MARRGDERALPLAGGPDPRGHIPALDGIRGIAILLVVWGHSVLFGGLEPTIRLDRIFQLLGLAGWAGVDLFFVLSGFLITGILYDAKGNRHYFRSFYARRVLRIVPLYYVFLALYFGVLPRLVPLTGELQVPRGEQVWYWTYLANARIALTGWPEAPALGHFWSLAVEEQFYLVWPLVVLLLSRRGLMGLCLAITGGSLVLRIVMLVSGQDIAAYTLTPARMDPLAIGGLIALVARGEGGTLRLRRWAWPAIGLSGALLVVLFYLRRGLAALDPPVLSVGYSLLATFFGGVVALGVAIPPGAAVNRVLAHRLLRFFGRYSYAIYVLHHPLVFAVRRVVTVDALPRVAGSQLPGQMVFTLTIIGVSLGAALVSWYCCEAPCLRLKRFFPYV